MQYLEYFLFETIYGIGIMLLPIVGIAWLFYKLLNDSPIPLYIAAAIGLFVFLSAPAIPRFLFQERTLAQARNAPGISLVKTVQWGAVEEPITWFYAPIGFFQFVGPSDPIMDISGPNRRFRVAIFRYKEQPKLYLVDVECQDGTYTSAEPDSTGVFRYTTDRPTKLTDEERKLYCDRDWSPEMKQLHQATQ